MLKLKAVTFLAFVGTSMAAGVIAVALVLVLKGLACVPVADKQPAVVGILPLVELGQNEV